MGEFGSDPVLQRDVEAKAPKNTISVNGVLRTRVTYVVPAARSTVTGDTRMIATIVPITSAPQRRQ
jgi:hypothetical protein